MQQWAASSSAHLPRSPTWAAGIQLPWTVFAGEMHLLLRWEEPEGDGEDGEDFGWMHFSGEEQLKTSGQYQPELYPTFGGAGMTLHRLSGGAWSSWHLKATTDLVVVTAELCQHGKCHPSLYGKGLRRGSSPGAIACAG